MKRMHSALSRIGRWPFVAGWAGVILALSSIPNFAPPESPSELGADKMAHFGMYFVLAALALAAGRRSWPKANFWLAAALVVAAVAGFGVLDEMYQRLIPGRDANALDWTADVLGAVAGVFAAGWILGRERGG